MIAGVHVVTKRKEGQPVRYYVYAWRGGPCIMTKAGGRKPAQLDAAANTKYQEALEDARAVKPNTLASLVRDWRKSLEFKRMAETTRKNWGRTLDMIEDKWGTTPLSIWKDARMVGKIMAWRNDFAGQPRTADARVTVLRSMLAWGRLNKDLGVNVAEGIPTLYEGGNREEIIWTDEDVFRFACIAPQQVLDGFRLAELTGLRRADLVSVTRDNVGEFSIVRTAKKKSRGKRRRATVPRIPALDALLEELATRPRKEGVNTLLVNSFGESWTANGFGQRFRQYTIKAGIIEPGDGEEVPARLKHLHDVRGTFATHLILCGLTDEEAAGILAWSPERVATIRKVYVDQARVVVAIGQRIQAGGVNPNVNRSGAGHE